MLIKSACETYFIFQPFNIYNHEDNKYQNQRMEIMDCLFYRYNFLGGDIYYQPYLLIKAKSKSLFKLLILLKLKTNGNKKF